MQKIGLLFWIFIFVSSTCHEISFSETRVMNCSLLKIDQQNYHAHAPALQQQSASSISSAVYYAHFSVEDFRQAFANIPEKDVLGCYELFSLKNFRQYARDLAGYNHFILALDAKIKQDKNFRKQMAYVPGFAYHFGLRGEKSEFHDFIAAQANQIRKKQLQVKSTVNQRTLNINDIGILDKLKSNWTSIKNSAVHSKKFEERLIALNKVKATHGAELDEQLHKELETTHQEIRLLESSFGQKKHVQVLAPVVHYHIAQAKKESNPIIAFGLSDFCDNITKILSHGIHVLYDASYAIAKGLNKGIRTVASIDHWKDMAMGMLQFGMLFAEAVGHEENFRHATALAIFSEQSDVVMNFAQQYCAYSDAQKEAIEFCAQETYQKLKAMTWQEVLESGTEIGTTLILDTLALHALGGFARSTSNVLIKEISQIAESGALLKEGYTVEVAGFGKLIVEEGAESATKLFFDSGKKPATEVVKKSAGHIMRENGKAFEDFLVQKLGGTGSFKVIREFDGAVGNVWYEAKSGGYWDMLLASKDQLESFKSGMGHRLKITKENGKIFQLHSNTPIPQEIKEWLAQKNISYVEWL